MPKYIADTGLAATIILMVAELVMPGRKMQITVAVAFVLGFILIAYALNAYFKQPNNEDVRDVDGSNTHNDIKGAHGNEGVITQGQSGNNIFNK